ncbi:MAG: hypothetical protein JWM41_3279 [Gemmatimonadetes bacterium]|nr:hypothetical protein [Gemmatimonadota bacterium]
MVVIGIGDRALEFRQLALFVAVAEERSFTRAAHREHIVQSGVSASIGALERELGVTLFYRSKHHVDLTEAGKALLVEARRTLSALATARAAAVATGGWLSGSLTIGLIQTLPPELEIPALLRQFHRAHPAVSISIQELSDPLYDVVRRGAVDVAIGPGHAPPGFTAIPIGQYPLAFVCSDEHPLANRRSVSFAALRDDTFINTPASWLTTRLVDRAFADAGIERRSTFEVNRLPLLLDLVQEGLGVAILPEIAAQFSSTVRFVSFRPALAMWDAAISFLGTTPATPAARAFVQLILSKVATREATVRRVTRRRTGAASTRQDRPALH